eukprot:TRINITY_DN13031_c0_g1_i1.p1 TRINITY_DN13031_c0_g1~~TRINITY_DN13031_c0_g1_i1.p1  ORF type:complete len:305 (-),score=60.64 TRINITY_DN13031_c0_g1_i1:39-953(-)
MFRRVALSTLHFVCRFSVSTISALPKPASASRPKTELAKKLVKSRKTLLAAAKKAAKEDKIPETPRFELSSTETKAPHVLSVDIGTRNFAYCKMDADGQVVNWGIYDILKCGVPGVVGPQVPDISTMKALSASPLFRNSEKLVIEGQILGKMKLLESTLHAFNYEKTDIVRPTTIHKYFATVEGDYKSNKQQSVGKCLDLLRTAEERAFFGSAPKRDDLADAFLLARYAHEVLLKNAKLAVGSRTLRASTVVLARRKSSPKKKPKAAAKVAAKVTAKVTERTATHELTAAVTKTKRVRSAVKKQ